MQALDGTGGQAFGLLDGFSEDPALGLPAGVLDRCRALLGGPPFGPLATGPPPGALGISVGFSILGFSTRFGIRCLVRTGNRRRRLPRFGQRARIVIGTRISAADLADIGIAILSGRNRRVALGHRLRCRAGVGHRGPPDPAASALIAAMISGPSRVTSPAPMVTTTSPGRAQAATCSATVERSGR